MKRKQMTGILLTLALLLTVAAGWTATAYAATTATDIGEQINLIQSKIGTLKQNDASNTWYYAVTDLDKNGKLEFVAASQHPGDRSTNLKVWEVNADNTDLTACSLNIDEDESFPDILTDNVDTFRDPQTNTWYYLINDNIVIADNDVYTAKVSVTLKDSAVSYQEYAIEHTTMNEGVRNVTHTDINGATITPEQYNAAGVNALAGMERGSVSFEWLNAADVENIVRLTDSFAVFDGSKAPTETLKIPRPAILQEEQTAAAATPAPAQQSVVQQPVVQQPVVQQPVVQQPTYLTITKNPTNESKKVGGTALFVANANAFDSLNWTMVSSAGGEYSVQSFANMFPRATVSGEYSTTLSIANVSSDMNGWGAYCTFYYRGQTARTSTAYIYVQGKSYETPDWTVTYSSMSGTAYRDSYSTLCVFLQNGTTLYLPSYSTGGYTCNITGEVGSAGGGSSCMVYYTGSYPTADSIYECDVWGNMGLIVPGTTQSATTVIEPSVNYYDFYTDDGVYVIVGSDGSESFFGDDGSWITVNPNGTYEWYDAETGWYWAD